MQLTVRSKAVQDDSVLLRQLRAAVMTPAAAALLSELEFVDNVPCFNSVTATPGVTFAANNTVVTLSDPLGRKYYSVPATPRFYRSDGTTTVEMHLIPGSDLNAVMVGFVRVPHKTPSTDYDIMNERNWWLYRPENGTVSLHFVVCSCRLKWYRAGSWCNNGENHRAQDSLKATPTNGAAACVFDI